MSHFYPLLALGNATGDCVHSKYPWTEKYLGECTENDKQFIGMLLGLTSILCWLVAQLPYVGQPVVPTCPLILPPLTPDCCRQLIKNYQNGKAESLSIWFLADWLTGDISNLIGCVLTKQVPTQVECYALLMLPCHPPPLLLPCCTTASAYCCCFVGLLMTPLFALSRVADMTLQLYTAIYFCLIDSAMVIQWLYYKNKKVGYMLYQD